MDPVSKWLFGIVIAGGLAMAGRVAHNSLDVAVLQNDITYIKQGVDDIKEALKK